MKMEVFGPPCPRNCSGHGQCDDGDCICNLDWTGHACDRMLLCPNNCSGHGLCQHGQCFCDPGFNGTSCAIYSGCLPGNGQPDCSGHGTCAHGQCFCDKNFEGDGCEISAAIENEESQLDRMNAECPNDGGDVCSGHGQCFAGQCRCVQGYYGVLCNSVSKFDDVTAENNPVVSKVERFKAESATLKRVGKAKRASLRLGSSRGSASNLVGQKQKSNVRTNGCPSGCSGHGDCDSNNRCLCNSGFSGIDCSKQSLSSLKRSVGVVQVADQAGEAHFQETGSGCTATCNTDRGTCKLNSATGLVQCECKAGSMWINGRADGTPDANRCDREACPGRCGMDDANGVARGSCVNGRCECDIGYAGDSCQHECPNRCSSHGRCEKNMDSNSENSYHCFCESPWTGDACDRTAHSSMVVSSMVVMAIITFVMGLCCIPLLNNLKQRRRAQRNRNVIRGEQLLQESLMGQSLRR